MQPLLTACFCAVLLLPATWACRSDIRTHDFHTEFCQADVVFKGIAIGGKSGLSMTQDGRQMEHSTFTFKIFELYKDNTGRLSESGTVDVSREYTEGDPCDAASFPDQASSFLVFAKGNNYLKVSTCDHSWPYECVPSRVLFDLPYNC